MYGLETKEQTRKKMFYLFDSPALNKLLYFSINCDQILTGIIQKVNLDVSSEQLTWAQTEPKLSHASHISNDMNTHISLPIYVSVK